MGPEPKGEKLNLGISEIRPSAWPKGKISITERRSPKPSSEQFWAPRAPTTWVGCRATSDDVRLLRPTLVGYLATSAVTRGLRRRLSLAKMLSGVNAFEISDIQEERN